MRGQRVLPVGRFGLGEDGRRPGAARAVAVDEVDGRRRGDRPEDVGLGEVPEHQPPAVQPPDQGGQLQDEREPLLRVGAEHSPGRRPLRVEEVLEFGEPAASGGRLPAHGVGRLVHEEAHAPAGVDHPAERPGRLGVQQLALRRRPVEAHSDEVAEGGAVHLRRFEVALEEQPGVTGEPVNRALAAPARVPRRSEPRFVDVAAVREGEGDLLRCHRHQRPSHRQTTVRSSS